MLAGAALNGLRAMACVRAHRHCRVELGFDSHHSLGCGGSDSPSRREQLEKYGYVGGRWHAQQFEKWILQQHCGVLELGETKAL